MDCRGHVVVMKRSEATRRIDVLLSRVADGEGRYLPRVQEVRVFGSYAGGALEVGDVDVAVEFDQTRPVGGSRPCWSVASIISARSGVSFDAPFACPCLAGRWRASIASLRVRKTEKPATDERPTPDATETPASEMSPA